MSNKLQIQTQTEVRSDNIVERKIEKYISYFSTQPRIQGHSSSVKVDLDKLREYNSITSVSNTQCQWITK